MDGKRYRWIKIEIGKKLRYKDRLKERKISTKIDKGNWNGN